MLSEIFIVAITPDLKFNNIDALSSFSKPLTDFYKSLCKEGVTKYFEVDGSKGVNEVFSMISKNL